MNNQNTVSTEKGQVPECRHTYATLMIAAGVNIKWLATYMGHSSVQITWDRYGHLLPGNEKEAAAMLDDFLERSTGLSGVRCK